MCTRYPIINRVSELKVHIELTRFVQPEKIEIDANERAVNEKSQYCFFVCTTFDSFLNDLEGMPLSLLEAMSYGNCCLVSNIQECAEVVEDRALIFKKSDVEDLREKLQEACDHPEMVMKMKNQAADFICEKYNWDEVVKETMNLYRR